LRCQCFQMIQDNKIQASLNYGHRKQLLSSIEDYRRILCRQGLIAVLQEFSCALLSKSNLFVASITCLC
jgi:hypothetical protein